MACWCTRVVSSADTDAERDRSIFRMFETLCYFNGTSWHGISYKGGGMSTHHGMEEGTCMRASAAEAGSPRHTASILQRSPQDAVCYACVMVERRLLSRMLVPMRD